MQKKLQKVDASSINSFVADAREEKIEASNPMQIKNWECVVNYRSGQTCLNRAMYSVGVGSMEYVNDYDNLSTESKQWCRALVELTNKHGKTTHNMVLIEVGLREKTKKDYWPVNTKQIDSKVFSDVLCDLEAHEVSVNSTRDRNDILEKYGVSKNAVRAAMVSISKRDFSCLTGEYKLPQHQIDICDAFADLKTLPGMTCSWECIKAWISKERAA